MLQQFVACPAGNGIHAAQMSASAAFALRQRVGVALTCAAFIWCAPAIAAKDDDGLFDIDKIDLPESTSAKSWVGFVEFGAAYSYDNPAHWSKLRPRLDIGRSGRLGDGVKWKIGARADVDLAYTAGNDFYNADVRRDQRAGFMLRENYLDFRAFGLDMRVGRQHVVWGEMVGLFFADAVSARDMREFFLPEFDQMRIPQWAVRSEYFNGNFHAELLWVPYPSFDKFGRPGADFFPMPNLVPGQQPVINEEVKPARKLRNSNYGLRMNYLWNGWDVSAFYYRSLDVNPVFVRATTGGTDTYTPLHDWIHQWGGTFSKDLGEFLLKGEGVLTYDRRVQVSTPTADGGLARQKMLDYAIGAEFALPGEGRMTLQYFERVHLDPTPGLLAKAHEPGWALLVNKKFGGGWEGEILGVQSLSRSDWMLRPKLDWNFARNWRARFGVDAFGGNRSGFFGRFGNSDRVYTEVRLSF
ncbi:MAG: hypothetical protein KF778_04585 [Rhodocyclaceae bacterium]|nr:hypothetical protein [Rhodocyclaceae bacterium]MBX3667660.1 hypothetical protein [Rhodocyclaceae bacterium]